MTQRRALTQTELFALETLIDEVGLQSFMEGVVQVATEKSAHVQANYADKVMAKAWRELADYLSKVSESEHMKIF